MKSLFINYFLNEVRTSGVNMTVTRILLGLYGVFISQLCKDYCSLLVFDDAFWASDYGEYLPFFGNITALCYVQLVLIVLFISFILGFFVRITGFISSVLLVFIISAGASHPQANPQFGILAIFLLIYIVFYNGYEIGFIYRDKNFDDNGYVLHTFHKWSIFLLALGYASDAFGKLYYTGISWFLDPATLRNYIHVGSLRRGNEAPMAFLILDYSDWFVVLSASIALFFEVFFLVNLFIRKIPIIFSFLGLTIMHLMIVLTMNIYYIYYFLPLYFLYFSWDEIIKRFFCFRKIDNLNG